MKSRLCKLLNRLKEKRINNEEELREQLERLQMEVGTSKALKISLEEQILTKEKFRKFTEQQMEEKDNNIIPLEKQLEEEKAAINQIEKEREELETYWMQNSIELEALKIKFNDCQERTDMSSKTQVELDSRIV
jgi:chromosome segregation ATPase